MKEKEGKGAQMSVRLPQSVYMRLKNWCHWEFKSMNEVVGDLIVKHLDRVGDNDPRKKK